MEGWKITLRDKVVDYQKGGNYIVRIVCADGESDSVYSALVQGINDAYPLSTDFKDIVKINKTNMNVAVGSRQAQDEFIDRLSRVRNEVDNWRRTGYANEEDRLKAALEAKQAEIEAKQSEIEEQQGTDIWGIVMVMCVAAALIILIKD